jgi:dienelactone hydrolase
MKRKALLFQIITISAFMNLMIIPTAPFADDQESGRKSSLSVESHHVDIWSDGTRISGDVFYPPGSKPGDRLPVIILCNGWGGVRSHLNKAYAPYFAEAGYVVLSFDYRGWGDSDSRLVIKGDMPEPDKKGEVTVQALAVRELVDPFDQTEDIVNAITFMTGDPRVDPERIGLWGTSYGGGHVVYVAAHDQRVKCIVSQVPSMESGRIIAATGGMKTADKKAIQRARGDIEPVPQGFEMFRSLLYATGLQGTPYIARMAKYQPVELADRLEVPVLIIAAKNDELIDNEKNGGLVYEIIKDKVPARYELFNMTHFQIYANGLKKARGMAIDWFDEHLGDRP